MDLKKKNVKAFYCKLSQLREEVPRGEGRKGQLIKLLEWSSRILGGKRQLKAIS